MKLKIKLLERNGNRLSLLLGGVPVIIANSIRRACIAEVPTMAIEHVFVYKNTSVMDDEIIAHRLGLIPLKTDLTRYISHDECDCGNDLGCLKCSTTLYLEAKAENDVRVVLSGELVSEDGVTVPVSPDIPIVKLAPGQEISVEMRALMLRGKEHAKWQPVSVAVARGVPVVSIDAKKCTPENCRECEDACPKRLIKADDVAVRITDIYKCTACKLCERACPNNAISVDINEDSSILTIESVGQLSPEDVVLSAIDILIRKLEKFGELIGGVNIASK